METQVVESSSDLPIAAIDLFTNEGVFPALPVEPAVLGGVLTPEIAVEMKEETDKVVEAAETVLEFKVEPITSTNAEAAPVIEPIETKPVAVALPFDITALLRALRDLPDVKVIAKPPFHDDEGTWLIDVHNTARWVMVSFNDVQTFIAVEWFMSRNVLGDTWVVHQNKEQVFKTVDEALIAVKAILEG